MAVGDGQLGRLGLGRVDSPLDCLVNLLDDQEVLGMQDVWLVVLGSVLAASHTS